ncbi:hypothetical protein KP509_1Z028100 [Ceratopteris richardii]|nr:hypothetical protein KP509_1Z028100 [Ceratopteris richardii]KAH6559104.1 hypothetical protein KP509_1Z028100 [Ceratopteris richardii]
MADEVVRFGILGCANIARKLSRAILRTPGVYLYAIGSRSLEKAQAFAKDNGFPSDARIYGSYQSVLDDEDVDAVYMPLPTSLHMEWVQKASEKGKHVLLEKPPALSTEEFDKIAAACELKGVQLMDGTMWVHHPRTAKMKELLKRHDLIGNILEVHSSFFVPMKMHNPNFFMDNIRCNAELDALGALGDLGWYCVRAILWVHDYDLPASVIALPGAQFTKGGVITRCSASFVWGDGSVASMHCSFHANMTMSLNVYGTKGTLDVQDFVIPYEESSAHFSVRSFDKREPLDVNTETAQTQESLMVQNFATIIKGIKNGTGGLDPSWPTITRKTQQILDAIKLSIEKGYREIQLKA